MMKILRITMIFLLTTKAVFSQSYTPADEGSKLHFTIRNFGFKIGGDFSGLKGSIVFDPKALSTSRFNVSVSSKTVDTDNRARDNHLRRSEYFDVEKYPQISFVSTKITESTTAGRFYVFGNLTIKAITKSVQFGFEATPSVNGYIFKGEFELNRRDFGVGGTSISMSDNLNVSLTVLAKK
jgi:polyisoprenoid-binding protein YceI